MSKNIVKNGGYNNYSIRSATLIENYVPGPMRQNILMNPDLALGKYNAGTFGSDELINNGPGTLLQAIPDASRSQYNRIFAVPTGNPYRDFAVDDRQTASYQVEQLKENPLSIYSNNLNGTVPGFDCLSEPDNFSSTVNKRKNDYKNFFEGADDIYTWGLGGQDVYEQYSGKKVNPNAEVVYNMSMDTNAIVNPMIISSTSNIATDQPTFSGKCYSGLFVPGKEISTNSGSNPPKVYNNYFAKPLDSESRGFMNKNATMECSPDRSLSFTSPLVLNNFT